MNPEEIRRYWDSRATTDKSAQSTTQDVYLREIEFRALADQIRNCKPKRVCDIGCGDGRTTLRLAREFPSCHFVAVDYSPSMIENAQTIAQEAGAVNVELSVGDVLQPIDREPFDLVYTTRCLINLSDWASKKRALDHIHDLLEASGRYLMVENFIEGHRNFNELRVAFGLSEIPVREHNHFFEQKVLESYCADKFDLIESVNISSTYYLVTKNRLL